MGGAIYRSFFIFYTLLSIFVCRIEWIEKDKKTETNKRWVRDKNSYVDNTGIFEDSFDNFERAHKLLCGISNLVLWTLLKML